MSIDNEEVMHDVEDDFYEDYEDDDDVKYVLTPWGCLYATLLDYGINLDHINGRVGGHIVEDFMDAMVKAGHVIERDEEDEE